MSIWRKLVYIALVQYDVKEVMERVLTDNVLCQRVTTILKPTQVLFVIDTTLMPQIAVKLKLEQVRKGSWKQIIKDLGPVFGFASSRILVRAGTLLPNPPGEGQRRKKHAAAKEACSGERSMQRRGRKTNGSARRCRLCQSREGPSTAEGACSGRVRRLTAALEDADGVPELRRAAAALEDRDDVPE